MNSVVRYVGASVASERYVAHKHYRALIVLLARLGIAVVRGADVMTAVAAAATASSNDLRTHTVITKIGT
jgi:hypothetical protein